MAAARRSTEEDSATRTALLDAAAQIMLADGYAAVTTRRVAARAGMNKALVFYYFGTMDELFLELFRRGAEHTLAEQSRALAGPQPLWAMWDLAHRGGTSSDLTAELVALANHRKALRTAIVDYSHRFRAVQLKQIGAALRERGVDPGAWPAEAVVLLIASVTRFLQMESAFGIDAGHRQTVELVERTIRAVEGERLAPPPGYPP